MLYILDTTDRHENASPCSPEPQCPYDDNGQRKGWRKAFIQGGFGLMQVEREGLGGGTAVVVVVDDDDEKGFKTHYSAVYTWVGMYLF